MSRRFADPIAVGCSFLSIGLSFQYFVCRIGFEGPPFTTLLAIQGLAFFLLFFPSFCSSMLKSCLKGRVVPLVTSMGAGFFATFLLTGVVGFLLADHSQSIPRVMAATGIFFS